MLIPYPPSSPASEEHQRRLTNLPDRDFAKKLPEAEPLKGDRLPSEHHVARHCRKNDLRLDPTSLAPVGILECALLPDPDGVSTTWLEFFQGDRAHNVAGVRGAIGLTPKRSNRLAVLNVGNIEIAGQGAGLRVIEDPLDPPHNPAHALVKEPADLQAKALREAIASTVQMTDLETY
ncbi:MAG TPA: hypothetical protein VNZ53_46980 [Steroidobacteraceae bacterium]|nr:hypothetical protein [Steroidobacteraceae bacterium]